MARSRLKHDFLARVLKINALICNPSPHVDTLSFLKNHMKDHVLLLFICILIIIVIIITTIADQKQ